MKSILSPTDFSIEAHHAIEEDGIILFADEINAGMIAMATQGCTGFAQLLSGSITEDVVNLAQRPVLTVNIG